MSTKEEPGPFDGMERAKPGEPVFTLQGGDPLGAPLVMLWAALARCRATGASPIEAVGATVQAVTREPREDRQAALLLRAREAEGVAWQMDDYRKGHVDEKPTPVARPSYAGNATDPAELEAKARFDAHQNAARRFDNAVAEINEAAEALAGYGFDRVNVDAAMQLLQFAAGVVRPKRTSYAHRGED
jgi:hypothetical protein